jgi:hypothetical protein
VDKHDLDSVRTSLTLSPLSMAVIQNVTEDLDSRLALAEIYERLDRREEALELVNEGSS